MKDAPAEPSAAVGHAFRRDYGRLVAALCRRVGPVHLQSVEDAAQSALTKALEIWPRGGVPQEPFAWLFRTAHNALLDSFRQTARSRRLLSESAEPLAVDAEAPLLPGELPDDLLRLCFVCCDEELAPRSQLVLALKVLCGLSVRDIAQRLFASEASVYKRLARGREVLRGRPMLVMDLDEEQIMARRPAVLQVLYLLFTEGYLSSRGAEPIREELCAEAIALTTTLAGHPVGAVPEAFALLALMHLHSARLSSRRDELGGLLLMEEQDRSLWDRAQIGTGLEWLAKSASGELFSRYHAEAAVAAEHCLAPSFHQTRWDRVADYYAQLEALQPSALHRLNRAVAVAEWRGADAGLEILEGQAPPTWLAGSHCWMAVLADLHRRAGHPAEAARCREQALALAPNPAIRRALARRLAPAP